MAVKAPKAPKAPAELSWHPYAESYPIMTGQAFEDLKASIQAHGVFFPIKYRIKETKSQFLDGRNRKRACDELGIKCPTERVSIPDDEVEDFIDSLNLDRRHLTQHQQDEKRQERIGRVADARKAGESLRTIAAKEGVSTTTVQKDLDHAAGVNGVTVEPESGKVTGKDGRKQSAMKPPGILCERCKRVGPTKGCDKCKEARKAAKDAKKVKDQASSALNEEEEEPEEQDIEEQIKSKNAELETWCRSLMKFAESMPQDPWMDDLNRREGAMLKLRNCCETVRSAKCSQACPKCNGDGCAKCHKTGRVTKHAFDQMG
jgi:ParB-like chromosome segregation protein Spo0J